MTDAELTQLLERLARLEDEVKQLTALVKELTAPTGEAKALREQGGAYATDDKQITLTAHPHIVRISGVQGGTPIVRNAYKTVWGIVELFQQGRTPEQIVEDKGQPLTLAQVYDALSYYYDNQEEIDGIIARQNAALEEIVRISHNQLAERARQAQETGNA